MRRNRISRTARIAALVVTLAPAVVAAQMSDMAGMHHQHAPAVVTAKAKRQIDSVVKATLPLGANKTLHLVRAGREIVLLGTAEQAIAPIRRYSEAEARALGLIDAPETVTVPMHATLASLEAPEPPKGFMNALRSKTVVK